MLTIDDFWKILKFLESGQTSDPTIDQNLTALAQSEKSKTEDFFEKILDIKPFLSMDYGRLRKFLVDWYSSHKTLVSTQKQISDIFSLPEQSLSELVQSFGYVSPIETLSFNTKINFFLDLVNLYKVKGSPLALERVLTYFGLNNIQLVEFWLMRDSDGELIFRPEVVTSTITDPSLTDVTLADITFEEMVSGDPHWMLTRDQIEQSLLVNSIGIPSISPYFSIYGYFNVALLLKYITILVRKVQDEYQEWVITHSTPDEIVLKLFKESSTGSSIKIVVSVLEVYLSAIYLWNLMQVATGGESSFLCYAGTSTDLNAIFALYDSLMTRTFTRLETKIKYETFMNVFTRLASSNFLITKDTAGAVLNLINPTLKTELDSWSSSEERAKNAIVYLLNELSTWYQQNISKYFPNLANITLGIDASTEVMMAINFFKPYRARVRAINIVNIQKNPALDSVITEDRWAGEKVTETIIDFDTADCLPGVLPDWVPIGEEVTSNPPIGARRIYNIYVDATHTVKAVSADATSSFSIDIVSSPPVGCYRVTNVYLQDNITIPLKLKVIYNDTPEPVGGIPTPLTSSPPYSLSWPFDYLIFDMYIDSGGNIFITYNSTHNPALADPGKKYYPRNTYDTGAYFDIGISCDEPPTPMDATAVLWLGEDFVRRIPRIPDTWINIPYYKDLYLPETSPLFRPVVDHYCGHPTDATSYVDVYHEPGSYPVSEPSEWFTDGGFYNRFDEGGYFDQPFPSDICHINVMELSPAIQVTSCLTYWGPYIPRGTIFGSNYVTILGSGFSDPAVVYFGTELATDVGVASGTEITCRTPAHAVGIVDVKVQCGSDEGTLVDGWEFVYTPQVEYDDGFFRQACTLFDRTNSYLFLGKSFANSLNCFIRFPSIVIPQGATIISAFLRFMAGSDESGDTVNLNIHFNDVNNAVAPTTCAGGNGLALTGAIAWNALPPWVFSEVYSSPDISNILQTIINRVGWVSGNSLQVVVKDNGSSSGIRRSARAIGYAESVGAVELHVTWIPYAKGADFAPHNYVWPGGMPPPFTVYVSSELPGLYKEYAFDGGLGVVQYWLTDTGNPMGWLTLDIGLGNTKHLYSYKVYVNTIPEPNRAPKDWTFEGSNNNVDWDTLDTQINQTGWGSGEGREFMLDSSKMGTAYRYFRLNVSANNGAIDYLQCAELYLYEAIVL